MFEHEVDMSEAKRWCLEPLIFQLYFFVLIIFFFIFAWVVMEILYQICYDTRGWTGYYSAGELDVIKELGVIEADGPGFPTFHCGYA